LLRQSVVNSRFRSSSDGLNLPPAVEHGVLQRLGALSIIEKIAFIQKTSEEEAAILEKIDQRWPQWHTDSWRKN
jgi:hypothetical protein